MKASSVLLALGFTLLLAGFIAPLSISGVKVYRYRFSSNYPSGYWEQHVCVPAYVGWSPSLSDMVAPAREFFPENARDTPLSMLRFTCVGEEEVSQAVPKVVVYNVETGEKWVELNVTPDRIASIASHGRLTAAFLPPASPPQPSQEPASPPQPTLEGKPEQQAAPTLHRHQVQIVGLALILAGVVVKIKEGRWRL